MRQSAADTGSRHLEYVISASAIGLILVAWRAGRAAGICAVLLGDDRQSLREELQRRFPDAALAEGGSALRAIAGQIAQLSDTPAARLDVALELGGTEFQRRVWQALREIPAGETASYAEIARRIGEPGSARAVAQACAANTLALVVPCHRVVRSDGGLAGYRWGIERKRALLEREALQ